MRIVATGCLAGLIILSACNGADHSCISGGASVAASESAGEKSAFYIGHWEPVSNVYQGMGALDIGASKDIRWRKCSASYVVRSDVVDSGLGRDGVLLLLSREAACYLDDERSSLVRFVRVKPSSSPCEMNVATYASEENLVLSRPTAEGLYARIACIPGGANRS